MKFHWYNGNVWSFFGARFSVDTRTFWARREPLWWEAKSHVLSLLEVWYPQTRGSKDLGESRFPTSVQTSSFWPPSILPEHCLLWLWHHSWRDQPGEDTESSSSNVMAKPSEGELEMEGTLWGNYSLQTGLGATGKTPLWELSEAPGADHCQGARSPCKQVSKNQAFWLCLLTRLHSLAWAGKADDIGAIL